MSTTTTATAVRPRGPAARKLAVVLVLAAIAGGAACSDGGSGSGRPAPQDASVRSMLTLVPDNAASRRAVHVNLYAKAAKAVGVRRPASGAGSRVLLDHLTKMIVDTRTATFLSPSDLAGYLKLTSREASADVGFDVTDMDADVQTEPGPGSMRAAVGRFDGERIVEQMLKVPSLRGSVTKREHHGTTYTRWFPDQQLVPKKMLPFDPLGRSGRLAVVGDDALLSASDDKDINTSIDLAKGDGRSLADAADFRDAARALDDQDVFAAALISPGEGPRRPPGAPGPARTTRPPKLVATGIAKGDSPRTRRLAVVIVNADEAKAKATAKLLRQTATKGRSAYSNERWSSVLKVESVTNDGRLTIGRFTTERGRGRLWREILARGDNLVMTG